jgi:hypothetical protein
MRLEFKFYCLSRQARPDMGMEMDMGCMEVWLFLFLLTDKGGCST